MTGSRNGFAEFSAFSLSAWDSTLWDFPHVPGDGVFMSVSWSGFADSSRFSTQPLTLNLQHSEPPLYRTSRVMAPGSGIGGAHCIADGAPASGAERWKLACS